MYVVESILKSAFFIQAEIKATCFKFCKRLFITDETCDLYIKQILVSLSSIF